MGYGQTFFGTLRDGASGCMIFTLGGDAHTGGGVDLRAGAIGVVGGLVDGIAAPNRSTSWKMVRICAFPNESNVDAGAGFGRASANMLVALAAFSAEEVVGILVS